MSTDLLEFARGVLAAQPFSVLLGAHMRSFSAELTEISVDLRPDLLQQFGFAHGGVISYLADNALSFSGGAVLGPDVLIAEYKINYIRPGQGERLIARASAIASSQRQAVCRCDVFMERNGSEQLCATAQGTIVRRPEQPNT